MKKITKVLITILSVFVLFIATTAFFIKDAHPDFFKNNLNDFDKVSISDLKTKNVKIGNFKATVNLNQQKWKSTEKEFYGQEIHIKDNPDIDKIYIGVTNNLISRIEVWNKNELVETNELGFMEKMTWGETQTMSVAFYDQTNTRYPGKSKIVMQFYKDSSFFGDIGIIQLDLSKFGDLCGEKELYLFAKSLESENVNKPEFSDLKIWKNYKSFD